MRLNFSLKLSMAALDLANAKSNAKSRKKIKSVFNFADAIYQKLCYSSPSESITLILITLI